jgi:bacterioferritin-associated ferredoxin
MIVCSCNVLSDQDVRSVVEAQARRSTSQVYGCLACSAKCGRCAHTIRRIMDEALGSSHFFIGVNWLSVARKTHARRTLYHSVHYSRDPYTAIGTT